MKLLTKARWMLWVFSHFKVPMIGYVKPKIIHLDDQKMVIKIKLRRKTKNHLNSMYFGVLAVGVDVAGGLHAFHHAAQLKTKASIVFKSFHAEFIKRAESDVHFISEDGLVAKQCIEESMAIKERVNKNLRIDAFVNYPKNPEKVASFILELSAKVK